jgi:putative endonuclease
MYTVYAIKSKIKNYIYVGLTSNLNERLHRHNSSYEKTTRAYATYTLIFSENFQTRVEARAKEKFLKCGVEKEFLKKIK